MQKTPLFECHRRLGARMTEFAGWTLPVQYEGILSEHAATRSRASIFDTCHMGRLHVSGAGSTDALSRIVTADLRALRPGRCRYGLMLNEAGGILDDLIAYRLDDTEWLLVVNAGTRPRDIAWLEAHLGPDAELFDATRSMAKLDVQGPGSPAAVETVLDCAVAALGRFAFGQCQCRGTWALVSRTGYTGETGFELYVEAGLAADLWQAFLDRGVTPAGLGARDTLRLEAGLPLYGHELTGEVTPVEAGLERYAAKDEPFIGQDACRARRAAGPTRTLAGFRIEGRRTARPGDRVRAGGRTVGKVTSGSYSPTLGCAIGMAYIDVGSLENSATFAIDTGRAELQAVVAVMPFLCGRTQSREGPG